MGIRVHKRLGYGLTDVSYDKKAWKFTDERINPDSPLLDTNGDVPIADYRRWLSVQNADRDFGAVNFLDASFLNDEATKPKRQRRVTSLSDCVVHQAEYGLPNVLCIRPASCHDWSRYDDPIDYIEESKCEQLDHVEELRFGIYPFSSHMDARTGERLNESKLRFWLTLRDDEDQDKDVLDRVAQMGGFASHLEALDYCVPHVPQEVRDLADYGNLFKDDKVWMQLRPILYVNWS
jgi:hypothetical protein